MQAEAGERYVAFRNSGVEAAAWKQFLMAEHEDQPRSKIVSAGSARRAALIFNIGNIVAITLPPLGMLWMAASMLIYTMNRHHPDERVGHYTQQAAYRLYGVVGFFVAAATFIPGRGLVYYLVAWGLAAAVLIPWSLLDIVRIRREQWQDTVVKTEDYSHEY